MKVGDTFRVFEVMKTNEYYDFLNSKTGIEIKFDKSDSNLPHRILLSNKNINNRMWFKSKELKQVGTIRIKSLKSGK